MRKANVWGIYCAVRIHQSLYLLYYAAVVYSEKKLSLISFLLHSLLFLLVVIVNHHFDPIINEANRTEIALDMTAHRIINNFKRNISN